MIRSAAKGSICTFIDSISKKVLLYIWNILGSGEFHFYVSEILSWCNWYGHHGVIWNLQLRLLDGWCLMFQIKKTSKKSFVFILLLKENIYSKHYPPVSRVLYGVCLIWILDPEVLALLYRVCSKLKQGT